MDEQGERPREYSILHWVSLHLMLPGLVEGRAVTIRVFDISPLGPAIEKDFYDLQLRRYKKDL
jgi:hypothetical protein